MIREADMVVSLDWVDLGGTLRLAHAGRAPRGTIVQCSLDQYSHNGWSMAHQALPPADIAVLADPDRLVAKLLAVLGRDGAKVARPKRATLPAPSAGPSPAPSPSGTDGPMPLQAMAEAAAAILAPEKPCYIRLPIGWPGDVCDFTAALDYLGFDGAGGIGSGPGMAVGAAFALQDSDRLPVAIIGDGDFLMSVTALWTAVHLRLPLLVVVANNRSFFNDELHQDRIARERGRPVENRGVAIRIDDPAPDLATLARGQGAVGYGPVATLAALRSTLTVAIAKVRGGATCVVDVHVAREYARGIPAAVLSEKADT
jgi:thiamine pyrophosphate-dependent acetolactate synthase large subunit-like protein